MKTSDELKSELIELFPEFNNEFDEDKYMFEVDYIEPLTHHRIWMNFAPVAYEYISIASKKNLQALGSVVNAEVTAGAERENAVSTCFLEHASQVSVRKLIKPFLNTIAKQQLR